MIADEQIPSGFRMLDLRKWLLGVQDSKEDNITLEDRRSCGASCRDGPAQQEECSPLMTCMH
jgi:hypothetical protein